MAGAAHDATLRWPPVHPARLPNDHHGQVSWLPDRRRAPPSRASISLGAVAFVERGSPVTVAGAARDWNPLPSANLRLPARPPGRSVTSDASLAIAPSLSSIGTAPARRMR